MNYPESHPTTPKYIIFGDIETTGLDPHRDYILTGSFSKYTYDTLKKVSEIELGFRVTNREWDFLRSEDAINVHGITRRMANNLPDRFYAWTSFLNWVGTDWSVFCCHANPHHEDGSFYHFDYAFLASQHRRFIINDMIEAADYFPKYLAYVESTVTFCKEADKAGLIDIPRKNIADKNGKTRSIKSYKLDELCRYFNIELKHHDAKSDRRACESIYLKLRNAGEATVHDGSLPEQDRRAKGRIDQASQLLIL